MAEQEPETEPKLGTPHESGTLAEALENSPPGQSLYGEIAPGWWLIQPLWVTFERGGDGTYVVSDELFLVYGVGSTLVAALRDYITSLIEYYQLVAAGLDSNPLDRPQFDHLQVYLRPVGHSSHAA